MRAKQFIVEIVRAKKKRKKKRSKSKPRVSKYYYPGFGYYGFSGSGEAQASGGDGGGGGGESIYESAITDLAKKLPGLKKHDYNTIDLLMRKIAARHKISAKSLHDLWIKKYKETPDDWIKGKLDEQETSLDRKAEVDRFKEWACNVLHIKNPPEIVLSMDTEQAQKGHHTGKMVPGDGKIWAYANNRNLVDILRTVFHELVHVRQHELNMIKPDASYPGSPIEVMADALAGKYIKIYGKKNPNIFESNPK